jgi:HSP20 family protein
MEINAMNTENVNVKPAAENDGAEHTRNGACYRPNVDIVERPDELLVLADVPGTEPGDVDLNFEDGTLTIHAKVNPRHREDAQLLAEEYGVGDYYRTFRISEAIDAAKISAEYADGVLLLHLPKSEALKPRRIQVKTA